MKSLMLGISMLSLFSLSPSFANGTDKDCCKKDKKSCTEAEKKQCADDKKCLQLCKEGKCDPNSKECKDAAERVAKSDKKSCCKK